MIKATPVAWKDTSTRTPTWYVEKAAMTGPICKTSGQKERENGSKTKNYKVNSTVENQPKHIKHNAHTFGARTSIDLSVNSRRNADVSENPVATCG